MQVRDMIEQLQKLDQNFRVVIENDMPAKVNCPECGESLKTIPFTGDVDGLHVASDRCEVVIDFV